MTPQEYKLLERIATALEILADAVGENENGRVVIRVSDEVK